MLTQSSRILQILHSTPTTYHNGASANRHVVFDIIGDCIF